MKKEYLQKICDKLNARGFTAYDGSDLLSTERKPFSLQTKEIRDLHWLPEENLKLIAEGDGYATAKDFSSLYQAWGRAGFFKFTPYIVSNKDNETLCVRHNKFLHMFRGYYFQLSGSPDGDGDYGHGLLRTDHFLQLMRYKNHNKSHLGFIILYAAMIDCGFQNDNFRTLFYKDKASVDDYFRKSMAYWQVDVPYGYEIIEKYMSYRDGSLDSKECGHTVYCFRDKFGVWCRFWLSDSAVEVEYCYDTDHGLGKSRIVRFDIPDPTEGLDFRSIGWWTDDDTEDLKDSFAQACFSPEKIEHFILLMLLKLVGVNSNYMASYPIRKIGYIKEDTDAITIEKFDAIMN